MTDPPPSSAAAACPDASDTDAPQDTTTAITMAEQELHRYIAESSGSSSSNQQKKRRRFTRSSELSGVDLHRVRTKNLHRLEELFWDGDAGYEDSDDEDGGDEDGRGDGSKSPDWKICAKLPKDASLKCSNEKCTKKAVATWHDVNNPDEDVWHTCLNCQRKDFDVNRDGWPDEVPQEEEDCSRSGNKSDADDSKAADKDDNDEKPTPKPAIAFRYSSRLQLQKIHDSPHIYIIENFLTEGELKHIENKIKDAEKKKLFEKSFVDKGDGAVKKRKSSKSSSGNKDKKKQTQEEEEKQPTQAVARDEEEKKEENGDVQVMSPRRSKRRQQQAQTAAPDMGEEEKKEENGEVQVTTPCRSKRKQQLEQAQTAEEKKEEKDEDAVAAAHGEREKEDNEKTNKGGGGGNNRRQQTDARQRTSTFIHFGKMSDSKIASIESRAAELLQLPHICVEPLQLVRYGPGQYFKEHHDMGVLFEDGSVELPPRILAGVPRRVVTILVYLNDLPPGSGGGTKFPHLSPSGHGEKRDDEDGSDGVIINPVRGRAVIWCNIDQTGMPDPRTVHEGMPLLKPPKAAKKKKKTKPKKKKAPAPPKKEKARKAPKKRAKKPPPPPRPPVDQHIRNVFIPRSDPKNPISSFGMNIKNVLTDGRTVLSMDYSHPHMAQRMGLQLGRLKEDDIVVSVNGTVVFDVKAERVLFPFPAVVGLMKGTPAGRSMKIDVLRKAKKVEEASADTVEANATEPVVSADAVPSAASAGADDSAAEVKEEDKVKEAVPAEGGQEGTEKETEDTVKEEVSAEAEEEEEEEAEPLPLLKYAMNIWACEE